MSYLDDILYGFHLHQGDNEDALFWTPDNSVDAVVTDPPYGWSFMGKAWDYDVPSEDIWREVLRVLKPGGHALIACGTRTQHRMAVNIENAGFEIRDVVLWLHGQGFPKSLNVSKAIDGVRGKQAKGFATAGGKEKYDAQDHSFRSDYGFVYDPKTAAAAEWNGWGTALKPAVELWTLARKPIGEKTVAANVLKHGTGAINVDGCRIGTTGNLNGGAYSGDAKDHLGCSSFYLKNGTGTVFVPPSGRWPANVILDETAAEMLDAQSGVTKSVTRREIDHRNNGQWLYGKGLGGGGGGHTDAGGASRFFYQAKVSPAERGESKHPTQKPVALMRYLCRLITPPGGVILDPFMGSGSTGVAALAEGFGFIGCEREKDYFDAARARLIRGVTR